MAARDAVEWLNAIFDYTAVKPWKTGTERGIPVPMYLVVNYQFASGEPFELYRETT